MKYKYLLILSILVGCRNGSVKLSEQQAHSSKGNIADTVIGLGGSGTGTVTSIPDSNYTIISYPELRQFHKKIDSLQKLVDSLRLLPHFLPIIIDTLNDPYDTSAELNIQPKSGHK